MIDIYSLNETAVLHPRVAYLLHAEGWQFDHNHVTPLGNPDFAAIHPDTGEVMIVECKKFLQSIPDVLAQLHRYETGFGFPNVSKRVYAFSSLKKRATRLFEESGVQGVTVPVDTPCFDYGSKAKHRERFAFLMETLHPWYASRPPAPGWLEYVKSLKA